jgi:hypothetical protein
VAPFSRFLLSHTIWGRAQSCASTRWSFVGHFEEPLEATAHEVVGCVPGTARYFRITDRLGTLPGGLQWLGERGRALITVTEHAREVLKGYESPEGTALRLDPANGYGTDGLLARLGFGEPRGDDQVIVDREGEELLRIDRSVSEELNGSEIGVVSTLEGPSLDIREPTGIWPLLDDS